MTAMLPMALFGVTFTLFFIRLVLVLLKKESAARSFGAAGITGCLTGLLYIVITAKRPPLYGSFEACFYMVFVLALLARPQGKRVLLIHSVTVLLIFSLQWGHPFGVNDDYYMYDNLWVLLFFNLRLLSAAFFVHVMVLHLACFKGGPEEEGSLLKAARYHLLLGAVIYLSSEWSGSLWCWNWFGDSWRWSGGFFKASILFFLVMLVCHLPQQLGKTPLVRSMVGMLPGIFALWMIFYH